MATTSQPLYRIGAFQFDPATGSLERRGETVRLPGLSARVLSVLAERAPDLVSAGVLAEHAWGLAHVAEDTIAQRIALLRRALGDDPKAPSFIRTERGRGYALIAPVTRAGADASTRSSKTTPPWRWLAALAGALVLTAGGWTVWSAQPSPEPAPQTEIEALLSRAGAHMVLHQRAETDRAIALLSAAAERAPDDARVMTVLSIALSTEATKFGGDRTQEAEALARRAIADDDRVAARWSALGYALDAQGRIDEALSAYLRAARLDPQNSASRSSAAYLMTVQGRLSEALRLDLESLETGSRSIYSEVQIARTLRLLGDDARAQALEARALLLYRDHPVVLSGLAEAALSRGAPGRALDLIERAAPTERAQGELARLAGRAHFMLGDRAHAAALFEAAGVRGGFERAALLSTPAPPIKPGELWPAMYVGAAEAAAATDPAAALAALEQAVALGWRDAVLIEASPFLQALRHDNALEPVLERIDRLTEAEAALAAGPDMAARLDAAFGPPGG
ncbi:MAG: winged helix-turn-helix domain-containing protein [Oceanicaulis sp.]